MERAVGYAVFTDHIFGRQTGLVLLQNVDDLLFRVVLTPHIQTSQGQFNAKSPNSIGYPEGGKVILLLLLTPSMRGSQLGGAGKTGTVRSALFEPITTRGV